MNRQHHPLEGRNNAAVLCGGVVPPFSFSSVTPNLDAPIVSRRPWIRRRPRPSIHPFRSRSRSSFRKMNHSAPPSTPFLSRSLSWVSNYISGERARVRRASLSSFVWEEIGGGGVSVGCPTW